MPDSKRGQLLIAAPSLFDYFRRTVILVLEHTPEGAMGVVLNRSSETRVSDAVPALAELPGSDELVRIGGPVAPQSVVALGDFTMLLPDHEHVYAFTRSLDGVTLTVLGNFSGTLQEVGLDEDPGELILSNYSAPATALRPWEARVHRRSGGLPPS